MVKKIFIYTLLMNPGYTMEGFLNHILNARWYIETVDLYFDGQYREVFHDVMKELTGRKLVLNNGGRLFTTLRP